MRTVAFTQPLPLVQSTQRTSAAPRALPLVSRLPRAHHPRRRARFVANVDRQDDADDDLTCGDAFREWIFARDRGQVPRDNPDTNSSCAASRVNVLFVGRDNSTVSVAAEAIFTDLCTRRSLQCFASHSVGIRVKNEGSTPDGLFIEAMQFKRGLDISRKLACSLDKSDLESYSLVVCMDENTRSELLYMVADEQGKFNDADEQKFVVLSNYCTEPRLRKMQFRSGRYSPDAINFLLSALVDACNGLLISLIESPPVPQA